MTYVNALRIKVTCLHSTGLLRWETECKATITILLNAIWGSPQCSGLLVAWINKQMACIPNLVFRFGLNQRNRLGCLTFTASASMLVALIHSRLRACRVSTGHMKQQSGSSSGATNCTTYAHTMSAWIWTRIYIYIYIYIHIYKQVIFNTIESRVPR